MTEDEINEAHVLKVLTASAPERFWRGLQERAKTTYLGEFATLASDERLNSSQKLSKLWQDRHFRMEWLLGDEARKCGLAASSSLIVRNGCAYILVSGGDVTMTQKYVQDDGGIPTPAKFRADLASVNAFYDQPSLGLGDEPEELFLPKSINGIILHSPVGKRFDEGQQALGSIGFYVPNADLTRWVARLSFAEIIAAYLPAAEQADRVRPTLRRSGKTGTEE